MIPTQTFESYPVFGDNATKVQPDQAKYANGFQQADVLPAEYQNWAWNKNTKCITDLNAGSASMEAELNGVLTAAGKTPDQSNNGQLIESIAKLIADAKAQAILAAHPVGSLYWSSNSTNPSQLFGGTWTQIKDRFVWAKGDSDTINTTGGSKTVTLTTQQMPSHTHSFTGTAVTSGANNRGHTHSVTAGGNISGGAYKFKGTQATLKATASGTISGGAYKFTGKAVSTGGMSGNESKKIIMRRFPDGSDILASSTGTSQSTATEASYKNVYSASTSTAASSISWSNAHTHSVTADGTISVTTNPTFTGIEHSHTYTPAGTVSVTTNPTFTGTAVTSGAESQTHTHSVTAAGTIGNTGSGAAVDKMPPYIIKYCWERTA